MKTGLIYLANLLLVLIIFSNTTIAQCVNDSGNYWNKSWLSCYTSPNPNPVRGNTHWLLYEFHQPESINETHIWNANRPGESTIGIQTAIIDYSVDGTTWQNMGTFTFPKANEQTDYEGFAGPSFEGIFVSKILITVENTYSNSSCASLAEIIFQIDPDACYGTIDICGVCDGDGESVFYEDSDGDGLGSPDIFISSCTPVAGYVDNAEDHCDNGLLGWNEVSTIFSNNGCMGCHGDLALGGLNLSTYDSAVQGGNKCGSDIMTGTTLQNIIMIDSYAGCGTAINFPSMNQRSGGQIDADELALIQTWIDIGAPEDCNCLPGASDSDNDGTCDTIDDCPGFDNQIIGTPCDDGIVCTVDDVWTTACDCAGQAALDSDNDGVCDIEDAAPGDPCTADGIIDGVEPNEWIALSTNDCDTDGINNSNGDIDDFSPCINHEGLVSSVACNCAGDAYIAGGQFAGQTGLSGSYWQSDGMPDGLMESYIDGAGSLQLSFPHMSVGEEICITLGFQYLDSRVIFTLNNNVGTFINPAGLDNYQAQQICIKTRTEGEQLLTIESYDDMLKVDGSSYTYCPCSLADPNFNGPDCRCPYEKLGASGNYVSNLGIDTPNNAAGEPDGIFTGDMVDGDQLILNFPNDINPGGQVCITLGFDSQDNMVKFKMGNDSIYRSNPSGDATYAPQEICFINKTGDPELIIEKKGSGIIRIDAATYNYCNECPDGAPKYIDLHVALEGAYNLELNEMNTALNTYGLLPGQTPTSAFAAPTPAINPYSNTPWNYTGTEGLGWNHSNYIGDETDWIMVSFRTGIDKNTEIARTTGLLNKEGRIRFPDPCALPSDDTPLYVVIEHRNHLGIMSPEPITIERNILNYDFKRKNSYIDITGFGQKQLPSGKWAMYTGDANQVIDVISYEITGADKTIWLYTNGIFQQYMIPDFNLDGDVNGGDKVLWFDNNGVSSRVPK